MHPSLVVARKDLRQRVRDRSAIVLGFVAPLAIAALMSFAFAGTESFTIDLAVVDGDDGPLADAFVEMLASPGLADLLRVEELASRDEAVAALEDDDVQAAVLVPAGFSGAATGSAPVPIEVLTTVDGRIAGEVASAVTESFVAQINADRLSVATAIAAGAPADTLSALAGEAATLRLPIQVAREGTGARELRPISYYAPGMAIFFVLFAIGFGARSWFLEQREGTLERMSAAIRPSHILLGKALAVFVYGIASLATMAIFTTVLFGADWGGALPAAALCIAMMLAIVSLTALVTMVARTERQAEGFASLVVFGLALLGGNFIFVSATPLLMRRLALLTPNGWALRGFVDLATGERSLATIVEPVAAILLFTCAVSGATAVLVRRLSP